MDEKRKNPNQRSIHSKDLTPIIDLNHLKDDLSITEDEPKIELTNSRSLEPIKPEHETPIVDVEKPEQVSKTDLNTLNIYADNIKIGESVIDANPAYSLYAEGIFDDFKCKMIIGIVTQEKLQITPHELQIQLDNGKLLIPQISEYAAIYLAMKLRDVVDNIQIGPANLIFESETLRTEKKTIYQTEKSSFQSSEVLTTEQQPDSHLEIITSTMSEISGYKIEKIISAVSTSHTFNSNLDFDHICELIKIELCKKAYKLKANAMIGLSYTTRPIPTNDNQSMIIGSATAVILRKQ